MSRWPTAKGWFDFLLVLFTGVLACTSYFQWKAISDSLAETQKVNRPFISLKEVTALNFKTPNVPITIEATFINTGAIPAIADITVGVALIESPDHREPTLEEIVRQVGQIPRRELIANGQIVQVPVGGPEITEEQYAAILTGTKLRLVVVGTYRYFKEEPSGFCEEYWWWKGRPEKLQLFGKCFTAQSPDERTR